MVKPDKNLKVVLTKHAKERLAERFHVEKRSQISPVLERAATDGLVSIDSGDGLIEYGCLLMAGEFDGDGSFTVKTVYNLSEGISRRLKRQMWNGKPSPWESSQVILPRENRGDAGD